MLRFLSAGTVLLAVASTATAGGHYVEVWNPPEARVGQPADKGKLKSAHSHSMGKVGTRRVVASANSLAKGSASASAAGKHGAVETARKTTSPRFIDIPRILTPEGNVLQVSTGRASVYVVR